MPAQVTEIVEEESVYLKDGTKIDLVMRPITKLMRDLAFEGAARHFKRHNPDDPPSYSFVIFESLFISKRVKDWKASDGSLRISPINGGWDTVTIEAGLLISKAAKVDEVHATFTGKDMESEKAKNSPSLPPLDLTSAAATSTQNSSSVSNAGAP